jgi:hypothetical protein
MSSKDAEWLVAIVTAAIMDTALPSPTLWMCGKVTTLDLGLLLWDLVCVSVSESEERACAREISSLLRKSARER